MFSRREFLRDSAGMAAALASAASLTGPLVAAQEPAKRTDSSELLRIGVIGVNGQGKTHLSGFAGKNSCVVATICDVDEAVIGNGMKLVEKGQGFAPKYEKDLRKVIDDKSIDCISIATPNHWHALAAIWALQAGKDVYVEKPVSHNVREGRLIVQAARKYNRICQTGTQSRSNTGMREAMQFIHDGKLGKITLARGLCYKSRPSIGKVSGPQEPPKTMDYNMWCGPAPMKPPMRSTKNGTVHYDWHWFWDYGNGDLGNQGIHEMDKARWGLKKNTMPNTVLSLGGRFGYVDDGETANTQIVWCDYGDCELIFEVRGLPTKPPLASEKINADGNWVGNIFFGSEGYLVCPNYYSGVAYTPKGEVIKQFSGEGDHYGNFAQAVRARKKEMLHADIEEGHLSSSLCHLGNISYRSGALVPFSKQSKAFGDSKEAAAIFEKMQEHLKNNKVPMDSTQVRLGKKLQINTATESFVNDKDADAMLFREYRKPFVVPEKV